MHYFYLFFCRKSGDASDLQSVKLELEKGNYNGSAAEKVKKDPIMAACLIKAWFKDIRLPIVPKSMYHHCIQHCNADGPTLQKILDQFPKEHVAVIHHLVVLCRKIAEKVDENKMGLDNLAIVMSPNVCRCPDSGIDMLHNTKKETLFVASLFERLKIDGVDKYGEPIFVGNAGRYARASSVVPLASRQPPRYPPPQTPTRQRTQPVSGQTPFVVTPTSVPSPSPSSSSVVISFPPLPQPGNVTVVSGTKPVTDNDQHVKRTVLGPKATANPTSTKQNTQADSTVTPSPPSSDGWKPRQTNFAAHHIVHIITNNNPSGTNNANAPQGGNTISTNSANSSRGQSRYVTPFIGTRVRHANTQPHTNPSSHLL